MELISSSFIVISNQSFVFHHKNEEHWINKSVFSASPLRCQLPAFAAERRAAAPLLLNASACALMYQCLLPARRSAANPPHAAAAVDRWDRQTVVASTRVQSWGDEPPNGVGCGRGTPIPTPHPLQWFGGKGLGNQYWSAISEST